MFRPLRRKSNAISDEDAREVLLRGRRGILAVNGDDGYPFALPVNYVFDAEANRIYFHGAKAGHKVDSLRRDEGDDHDDDGDDKLDEADDLECLAVLGHGFSLTGVRKGLLPIR